MDITLEQLRSIMVGASAEKMEAYLPYINAAMSEFGINTSLRQAAFLAQLGHESGSLRYMEEIASGAAYEGRRDLGNTQPGDGRRYKGRGPIQLTGRANYARFGELLGLDLVGNPTQAATPQVGFRIAGLFWKSRGLNELADQQEFRTITKRINGGFNGLDDRLKYYERAKRVLSDDSTRGLGGSDEGRDVPTDLSRGIYPGLESENAETATTDARSAAATGTPSKSVARKGAAKKSAGTKSSAKKGASKKGGSKKSGAKQGGAKKSVGKGAAKKSATKKGGSKKGGAKKGTSGKGGAKKGSAKSGAKKATKRGASKGGAKKSAKRGSRGR